MSLTTALLHADDLFRIPHDGWRSELVEGVLHRAPSTGFDHGSIAGRFGGLLFTHVHPQKMGRVLAAETGFLISTDPDTVLAPDVAFVRKERLASFEPGRHAYFPGAPDFLVEVLSPSDTYSEVEKKVARWLAAGARIVVLADSPQSLLFVHRPGRPVEILSGNDTLDASDGVPGWKIRVGEIFEAGSES
jgi:Uma2 family endonuclease